MRRVVSLLLLAVCLLVTLNAQTYEPTWDSVDKRPIPAWFSDAKFGIFIHWGTYSVPAYAPVIPGKLAYAEWYWHAMTKGRIDPNADELEKGTWAFHQKVYGSDFHYQNFATQFKAELFDPDHWAEVLAGSGAKYVVLTSKHHEGFALWPSKEASLTWGRPWNAVEIGPKRDLLGDLSEAVTVGIPMGERTKDQSEPDIAVSRSISRPELQTHIHHVTDVEVSQIDVGVHRRREKHRQHLHGGAHLRIGHGR